MLEEHQTEMLHCPLCSKKNKAIPMELDEKNNFWRCPQCWTEVWPDEHKLKEIVREMKSKKLEEQNRLLSKHSLYPDPLPPVVVIDPKARGGSKSGSSRKKPLKKNKLYELI